MIARLSGKLIESTPGRVVIDVAGVGYDVEIPLSTFYTLAGSLAQPSVSLHVHTHVREDALQLFGFATPAERNLFRTLIAISGVGPRMALAILSGIGTDELERAVASGDRGRMQKIPGVGKKTAERLLLELRDKLDLPERSPSTTGEITAEAVPSTRSDAISALVNLGYPETIAGSAVDRSLESLGSDVALETLLRAALSRIVG